MDTLQLRGMNARVRATLIGEGTQRARLPTQEENRGGGGPKSGAELGLGAWDQPNRLTGREEAVWSAFVGRGGHARGWGRRGARRLLEPKWEWGGSENGWGSGTGAAWKDRNGKKCGQQQPPTVGARPAMLSLNRRGRGARATRCGVTDKWGQASRGPGVNGGVREGERRVRQRGGGVLACRPGQHSAERHDSKLGLNRTKIQMGPNQFQIFLIKIGPFASLKISNKIWLERI
jgi:hypothetical protein